MAYVQILGTAHVDVRNHVNVEMIKDVTKTAGYTESANVKYSKVDAINVDVDGFSAFPVFSTSPSIFIVNETIDTNTSGCKCKSDGRTHLISFPRYI